MNQVRIAELLQPFLQEANDQRPFLACPEQGAGANDGLYHSISTYIDILLRWNAHINLTAIRDPEDIVTRHFGESLFAARHLFPKVYPAPRVKGYPVTPVSPVLKEVEVEVEVEVGVEVDLDVANDQRRSSADPERGEGTNDVRVADLGSGAGFPGLPIKLWAPNIALTLIESNHKKATFLREVTRALTLTDVNIQNIRAQGLIEDLPKTGPFDVVTLRAVERFEDTLPTAATLLAPSGRLALLIGASQLDQAQSKLSTFTWQPPIAIPNSRTRTLLIGQHIPQY
jgi:16S rRNA (guanine527-N7)-methyltransferase